MFRTIKTSKANGSVGVLKDVFVQLRSLAGRKIGIVERSRPFAPSRQIPHLRLCFVIRSDTNAVPIILLFFILILLLFHTLLLLSTSPQTATLLTLSTRHVLLLILDPSVLEPNLDLFFRKFQVGGNLNSPESGQVHVGRKFALQLEQLGAGEGRADPLGAVGYRAR